MAQFEYVGRQARFLGKSLPQICLKLKNFGMGRMFVRDTFKRYPEITYYVLTRVEPDMSDEYLRRGIFHADVIFRGERYGNMLIDGNYEDYQLVAKEDEKYFLERTLSEGQRWREPTKVPKFSPLPPLLKEILKQEAVEKGVKFEPDELKLPTIVKQDVRFSHVVQE